MEDLINKYFEKSLTEKELADFYQKLETEPEFKAEFEFQKSVQTAIRSNERAELKSLVSSFEKPKQKSIWWKYAAAAVVVILAGVGIFSYLNLSKSNEDLYLAYYQTYPNVVAPNVRGENKNNFKNEAFRAYDTEDYKEAIRLFSQIKNEEFAVFYSAVSYLELDENPKAIQILESGKFSDSPYPFETYRKWYLALAYLKTNQKENGKKILKELVESENPQKEKAMELLSSF